MFKGMCSLKHVFVIDHILSIPIDHYCYYVLLRPQEEPQGVEFKDFQVLNSNVMIAVSAASATLVPCLVLSIRHASQLPLLQTCEVECLCTRIHYRIAGSLFNLSFFNASLF
jgi:hypothetical protein